MTSRRPIDKRSSREFWEKQFRSAASEPLFWAMKSDDLQRAFELLVAQAQVDCRNMQESPEKGVPSVLGVAAMLGALALENSLKGVLLSAGIQPFDAKDRFALNHHRLLDLADQTGTTISIAESNLLEKLEAYLTWAGRYPIPLSSNDLRPRPLENGGFAPLAVLAVPSDFVSISALIRKFRQMLPAISYQPNSADDPNFL